MSRTKIVLNSNEVRKLLKSKQIESICRAEAEKVKSRCGDGYEVDTFVGKNRINASISAATYEAALDNSENNTLLKAVKR